MLDEAGEVERDLRIGRPIVRIGGRDGARGASLSTSTTQGVIVPRAACQTSPAASPPEIRSDPKKAKRQLRAWTRADPIRSSQTCAAR